MAFLHPIMMHRDVVWDVRTIRTPNDSEWSEPEQSASAFGVGPFGGRPTPPFRGVGLRRSDSEPAELGGKLKPTPNGPTVERLRIRDASRAVEKIQFPAACGASRAVEVTANNVPL